MRREIPLLILEDVEEKQSIVSELLYSSFFSSSTSFKTMRRSKGRQTLLGRLFLGFLGVSGVIVDYCLYLLSLTRVLSLLLKSHTCNRIFSRKLT